MPVCTASNLASSARAAVRSSCRNLAHFRTLCPNLAKFGHVADNASGDRERMGPPKPSRSTINLLSAVALEPDENGFHAYVDGATEREALKNIKEAVPVYLDSLALHGDPLPVGPYLAEMP
jgi:predicted RNase H-like HicB family nuclease